MKESCRAVESPRPLGAVSPWASSPITSFVAALALTSIAGAQTFDVEPLPVVRRGARPYNPEAIAVLRWYEANTAYGSISIGPSVSDVVYDGENLWVAHGSAVECISPHTGLSLGSVDCGRKARRLAFDGKYVWVTLHDREIGRFPVGLPATVEIFPTGIDPVGMAFDGRHLWVANQSSGSVTKIDPIDGSTVTSVAVGNQPVEVAFDGAHVWVANFGSDTVSKIEPQSASVLQSFPAGDGPHGVAFDGRFLWVSSSLDGNLLRMDRDGSVSRTIPLATGIRALTFDGVDLWVASVTTNQVFKVDALSGEAVGPFLTGLGPEGIAFDGVNVWTANGTSGSITRF